MKLFNSFKFIWRDIWKRKKYITYNFQVIATNLRSLVIDFIEHRPVTNKDGATTNIAGDTAKQFFNNAKLDNCIVQIIQPLMKDEGRQDFELKSADGKIVIEKETFKDMSSNIVDDSTQISRKNNRQVVEAKLLVKKPDLAGTSKWSFVFDRIIEAEVQDKEFIEKVRLGQVEFTAGSVLPCKLLIEVPMDERNNPLAPKYTVLEVTGKVFVLKDEDTQKKLFSSSPVP